jgi:hypothetical protein
MTQKPPNIRAATIGEIEEYERRRQNGGGDEPPEGLKELFHRKINDLTLSLRNKAKGIARREIFALEAAGIPRDDTRLQVLDHNFNAIARGGVSGAVLACRVLLSHPQSP